MAALLISSALLIAGLTLFAIGYADWHAIVAALLIFVGTIAMIVSIGTVM